MRIYTRRSRALANALLLVFLGLVYLNGRSGDLPVALMGLAIAGAAIVYYGYSIASQHCLVCRESIVVPCNSYEPVLAFYALITPFRVPMYCPHCHAPTSWKQERRSEDEDAV